MPHRLPALIAVLLALVLGLPLRADAVLPIEDYARYVPQSRCSPTAKEGTTVLARWMVRRYGGSKGAIGRPCSTGSVSEHKEGRAFDWVLDARFDADRARARAFLTGIFATDAAGNPHAKARRMGVMYVIWNDHIWSSYNGFRKRDYLSSGCPSLRRCSPTLRHRDHLHVSLSRPGGRGRTSWYVGRVAVSQTAVD